jgi:hypothetical protein
MFNALALANTVAIIDLILHPLFHLWVSVAPRSYEWTMNLFVAGLHLKVTDFDSSIEHIFLGTIVEAGLFWLLAYGFATLYSYLARNKRVN